MIYDQVPENGVVGLTIIVSTPALHECRRMTGTSALDVGRVNVVPKWAWVVRPKWTCVLSLRCVRVY
jgi:hypothetical protein